MQFSSVVIAASGLAAAGVAMAQNDFSVNTPASVVQCLPLQISWTGGQGPFTPLITKPMQTSMIVETLPQVTGQSTTWTVDLPAGQTFTIVITDSTGATAPSAVSPAIASGSDSCLSSSGSSSASSSASGSMSSSAAASSSTDSSSSSDASSSSKASSSSARSTGDSSSSTATPTNTSSGNNDGAASIRGFAAVIAGVVGIGAAALA